MTKYFDTGTLLVIVITIILFTVALFVKGFTHGLLLETGVLLVSIKLIMMAYRNSINYENVNRELNEIKQLFREK